MYHEFHMPYVKLMSIVNKHLHKEVFEKKKSWKIVVYLTSLCVIGPFLARVGHFTHERVEYNVFWFDEPLKSSKSFKIFKISLTFRFDKL
jgi:hypothetical protein